MKQSLILSAPAAPVGREDNSAANPDAMPLVVIRAVSSGVHYGRLKKRIGDEVELVNTRRIYYWKGAASLSQLAVEGVSAPRECKISVIVPTMTVLNVCEIIPVQDAAKESLDSVPFWRA